MYIYIIKTTKKIHTIKNKRANRTIFIDSQKKKKRLTKIKPSLQISLISFSHLRHFFYIFIRFQPIFQTTKLNYKSSIHFNFSAAKNVTIQFNSTQNETDYSQFYQSNSHTTTKKLN